MSGLCDGGANAVAPFGVRLGLHLGECGLRLGVVGGHRLTDGPPWLLLDEPEVSLDLASCSSPGRMSVGVFCC